MVERGDSFTLIVATDGSIEARNAVAHALRLARGLRAKLYILYVVDTLAAEHVGVHMPEAIREMRRDGEAAIRYAKERAKEAGVEAEELLVEGRPREVICTMAAERGADVLIIGARGRSAIAGMLLGSVSEYVVHHAKCPVMVVPPKAGGR